MTTVVLVDDQAMIRAGLRGILEDADIAVLGEAGDGLQGVEAVRRTPPDVVLMDLRMPRMDGIEAVRQIRADPTLASVRVLVLTTFDGDQEVVAALSAGADGFLSKAADPEELVAAIIAIADGKASLSPKAARSVIRHLEARSEASVEPDLARLIETLTPRERDIVRAAAAGHDNHQIASQLFISPLTVKTHLNRAMMKLEARDRGQLVAIAYRSGLARP